MKKTDAVLAFLKNKQTDFISGEEISRKLKVSRAAVWKEIQALRAIGYQIESQIRSGYRLVSIPDKLFADEIKEGLKTRVIGRQIFSFDSIDSTNDTLFKLGKEGLPEGVVVFAEHQKRGRGRLGRVWESPSGKSVLFSYLLRPNFVPAEVSRITLVAALSIRRAIQKYTGINLEIKWPNDLLHENKKVCGILTEMSAEADRMNFVVVGVGVNVNSAFSELPQNSKSLFEICEKKINRIGLARAFLQEIEIDYQRLLAGDFEKLAVEWTSNSATIGHRITAHLLNRKVEGQALAIDFDGALWIRQDNGLQERILSGDIEHLR